LDLAAAIIPAKEVGGDLYDFFIRDGKLFFCIGDVSGKGIPASLVMAVTRSLFRATSAHETNPQRIVTAMNDTMSESNESNMFVTFFCGVLNLATGHLHYCNAGHNPPLIISPDGTPTFLPVKSNLAAGLMEQFPYQDEHIDLQPGTRIVVYTDGVTEAETDRLELYGEQRLIDVVSHLQPDMDEAAVVNHIYQSVKTFTAGHPQNDDITIMSVKV
jgi:sigma-B regulation protein RsbU (phosphoserine phosphatase)